MPDFTHITTITEEEDYKEEVSVARERQKGYSLMEAMERTGLVSVSDEVAGEPWEV